MGSSRATITPCIKPSWPLKVIPFGPARDLPFLSNFEIDFPP
jgi:hypothetical protein